MGHSGFLATLLTGGLQVLTWRRIWAAHLHLSQPTPCTAQMCYSPQIQGTVPSGFQWIFHPERKLKREVIKTRRFSLCSWIWQRDGFCVPSPLCILDSPLPTATTSVCFTGFLDNSHPWANWAPSHHDFLKIGCSTCSFRVVLGKSTKVLTRVSCCFHCVGASLSPAKDQGQLLCKDGDSLFTSWSLKRRNVNYLYSTSSFISNKSLCSLENMCLWGTRTSNTWAQSCGGMKHVIS